MSKIFLRSLPWLVGAGVAFLLSACGSAPAERPSTALPSVIPPGVFAQMARENVKIATPNGPAAPGGGVTAPIAKRALDAGWPSTPAAFVYVSLTSQNYLAQQNVDPGASTRIWETFLRKYQIPMVRISQVEEIEKVPPQGVLVLPSVVALSTSERQSIQAFRTRGGAVLSTWLTGVRNEKNEFTGFDFMSQTLGVLVKGTTQETEDDNYLIVHGNSPIQHDLPAGTRVWLERIANAWPLRLSAAHEAGQIMSWGRTYASDKTTGLVTFDERSAQNGLTSRNVVIGYPEAVWASANPRQVELLAYDAMVWLFRQPAAYVADWPHPYTSAVLMAIQSAEEVADVDLEFARQIENAGGLSTFYILAANAKQSAPFVNRVQSRGHEIAYLGDKFEGFADQSESVQSQRLSDMRKGIAAAGIKIAPRAGFSSPLDSYDKTTQKLLQQQRVDHYLAFMDETDGRMPYFPTFEEDRRASTVVMPMSLRGPEDAIQEGDPNTAIPDFLKELSLSEEMGSLSIIRVPSQSLLTPEQRGEIINHLKAGRKQLWVRPARQIAQWWRDRSRITTELSPDSRGLLLKVRVVSAYSPKEQVAVWVNLPRLGSRLTLESPDPSNPLPPTAPVDAWRSAILLDELPPGEYQWYLHFDPS